MVERWSSKPYAWVRFLLPLQHIISKRFNSPQKNLPVKYFNLLKKNSLEHSKAYLPLASQLLHSRRTNPSTKVYFLKRLSKNRPGFTVGSNYLFQKTVLQYVLASPLPSTTASSFFSVYNSQFNYSRVRETLQTLYCAPQSPRSTYFPQQLMLKRENSLTEGLTSDNLRLSVLKKNLVQSPKLYYQSLQRPAARRRLTKFLTNTQLLRLSTNKYGSIRKLLTWRNFQTDLLSHGLQKNTSPATLTLNPNPFLHDLSSALVGALPTANSAPKTVWKLKPTPYSKTFGLLFTQGLYSSTLLYKKFFTHNSPKTTTRLLNYFLQTSSKKTTPNNIVLQKLGSKPRFFIHLKNLQSTKFQTNFLVWYNFLLIRFLENMSGLKVSLLFNPYLHNSLSFHENAQLNLWTQRVKGFQRLIGPKVSLKESLAVTYLSLKLKDPTLFSNWMSRTIHKVSFWKYRAFFRYLKFLFHNLFLPSFTSLGMKGVKLKLKGKVSVAGNARTRAIYYRIGNTSQSTFKNKTLYNLNFFHTFTGILGLQIWYYF